MLTFPAQVDVVDVVAAIDRLRRAGALRLLRASLVERNDDDTLGLKPLPHARVHQIDATACRRFLAGEPGPSDGRPPQTAGAGPAMSESFLAEAGEAVRTAPKALILVTTGLEPAATVHELRHLPETRLVYGVLPRRSLPRFAARGSL